MKTTEADVQAIFNSLPEEGDELTFRINDDAHDGEVSDKLLVNMSLPLGQHACHLEGVTVKSSNKFTADFTYSESTIADGRIVIYD